MRIPRPLLAAALVAAAVAALHLAHLVFRLQAEAARERRVQLYVSKGLSRELAELFITRFPTNDNETWILFAIHWSRSPASAEAALKLFLSVREAVDYLEGLEEGLTGELLVVDVRGSSLMDPRLLTLVTLQGVVNREGARLYVIFKDSDAWWLARAAKILGLKVEFAGMDDAVRRFASQVEGYVIYDPAQPDTINVGTTLCGIYNGVLVHPTWVGWLERLGVEKRLFDLRGKFTDRVSAYQWAFEELWDRVDRTKLAVACPETRTHTRYGRTFTSNLQVACRDYAVALRLLTVYLDPFNPAERAVLERILSAMPNNSMVLGWHGEDEWAYVDLATRYGKYVVVMMHHFGPLDFANPTVWMHLKPPEDPKFPLPPVRPEVLGRDGVYVTFYVTDGDNLQWDYNMVNLWQRRLGVPVAWTVSPFLLDVAPFMVYYYARTMSEHDTFVCGPSGAGYIYPTSNKPYLGQYLPHTSYHLEKSGLRVVEVLGYDDDVAAAYAVQLSPWLLAVKRDYNELPGLFKAHGSSVYYVRKGNLTIPVVFGALHFRSTELGKFASDLDEAIRMYAQPPTALRFNPADELPGFGAQVDDPDSPTKRARLARAGASLAGALVYGPYTELPAGSYTVRFALKISARTEARVATIDVCTDIGRTIIAQREISGSEFVRVGSYQWFEINFTLAKATGNMEFRVWYDPGSGVDLYAGAVELTGIQPAARNLPIILVISQPWDVEEFEGLRRILQERPQIIPINFHELVALVNVEYGHRLAVSLLEDYVREGKLTRAKADELKSILDEALSLYRAEKPYDAAAKMIEFYRALAAAPVKR
ncbi:MAG: GxGYxYP family putative glycoside hydrolase [Thermofilaceae archaeon]